MQQHKTTHCHIPTSTIRAPLSAYLSPLLHFNLGFPVPPLTSTTPLTLTRLKSQPLIPHGAPLARAITCARVASPLSVDKQLQPAFLDALKRYFESGARIVCEGDLVAVSVDGASRRALREWKRRTGDLVSVVVVDFFIFFLEY